MNIKLISKLSPKTRKLFAIIFVVIVVVVALTVGLYYGLKSSRSTSSTSQASNTSQPNNTRQPSSTTKPTMPIPEGKTDITTGKMVIYEPITLKNYGSCGNGSTRLGFMNTNGELVNKELSSDINFPELKIILSKNSLYLKRLEDTNNIKLWYILNQYDEKKNHLVDNYGFFGRILAYEQQTTSSPIYKYMVWLDFTDVPTNILNGWSELPKSGYYNLLMNTSNMTADLEFLDDLYISKKQKELNYVCKQSLPKKWQYPMKSISSD
jgi:hypothetical protein